MIFEDDTDDVMRAWRSQELEPVLPNWDRYRFLAHPDEGLALRCMECDVFLAVAPVEMEGGIAARDVVGRLLLHEAKRHGIVLPKEKAATSSS